MTTDPAGQIAAQLDALTRHVDLLTTHVRRAADALTTPTDDAPTTGDDGPADGLRERYASAIAADTELARVRAERDQARATLDHARAAERRLRDAMSYAGLAFHAHLAGLWCELVDALDNPTTKET